MSWAVFRSTLELGANAFFFVLNIIVRIVKWLWDLITVKLYYLLPLILAILVTWYAATLWREHHVEVIETVDFYYCEVEEWRVLAYQVVADLRYSLEAIQCVVNVYFGSMRIIILELAKLTVLDDPTKLTPLFNGVTQLGAGLIRATVTFLADPFDSRFNTFIIWDGWLTILDAFEAIFEDVCTDLFPVFQLLLQLARKEELCCIIFHTVNAPLAILKQVRNLALGDPENNFSRVDPETGFPVFSLAPLIRETCAAMLCVGDYIDSVFVDILIIIFGEEGAIDVGIGCVISRIYCMLGEVGIITTQAVIYFAQLAIGSLTDANPLPRPSPSRPPIPGLGPAGEIYQVVGSLLSSVADILKGLFEFIDWTPLLRTLYNEACREAPGVPGGSWDPLTCDAPVVRSDGGGEFPECDPAASAREFGFSQTGSFYVGLPQCGPQLAECVGYSVGLLDICLGQVARYSVEAAAKVLEFVIDLVENGNFRFGELLAQPLLNILGASRFDDYTSYGEFTSIIYNPDGTVNERAVTNEDLLDVHINFSDDQHEEDGRPYSQTGLTCLISTILVGKCGTALGDAVNAAGHIVLIPVLIGQEMAWSDYDYDFGDNPLDSDNRDDFNEFLLSILCIITDRILLAADISFHLLGCLPGLELLEDAGVTIVAVFKEVIDTIKELFILTVELTATLIFWIVGLLFGDTSFLSGDMFSIFFELLFEWLLELFDVFLDLLEGLINYLLFFWFPSLFGQNTLMDDDPGPATFTECFAEFSDCICGIAKQIFDSICLPWPIDKCISDMFGECGCFDEDAEAGDCRKRQLFGPAYNNNGTAPASFPEYLAVMFDKTPCGATFDEFRYGKPADVGEVAVLKYLECVGAAADSLYFADKHPEMTYDWAMRPDLIRTTGANATRGMGVVLVSELMNAFIYSTDPDELLDRPEKNATYLDISEELEKRGVNDTVALSVLGNVQGSVRNGTASFFNFLTNSSTYYSDYYSKNVSLMDVGWRAGTTALAAVEITVYKLGRANVTGKIEAGVKHAWAYYTGVEGVESEGGINRNPAPSRKRSEPVPYEEMRENVRTMSRRMESNIFPKHITHLNVFENNVAQVFNGFRAYFNGIFWRTPFVPTEEHLDNSTNSSNITLGNVYFRPLDHRPDSCNKIVEYGCPSPIGAGCDDPEVYSVRYYENTPLCQSFFGFGAVFTCEGNESTVTFFPNTDCSDEPFEGFPQTMTISESGAHCFLMTLIDGDMCPPQEPGCPAGSLPQHMCVLDCAACPVSQVVPGFQCQWLDNSYHRIREITQNCLDKIGGPALDPTEAPPFDPSALDDVWVAPEITQRQGTDACGNGIVEPEFGEECDLGNFTQDPNRTLLEMFPFGLNYPCSGCNGCFNEVCGNMFPDCRSYEPELTPIETINASLPYFGLPIPFGGVVEECDGGRACSPGNITGAPTNQACVRLVCGDGRLVQGRICPTGVPPVCYGLVENDNPFTAPFEIVEVELPFNATPADCQAGVDLEIIFNSRPVTVQDPNVKCAERPDYCFLVKEFRECSDEVIYEEECDDGNRRANDGCDQKCRAEICPDAYFSPGNTAEEALLLEECDDAVWGQVGGIFQDIAAQCANLPDNKEGVCSADGDNLVSAVSCETREAGENCILYKRGRTPNRCFNDPANAQLLDLDIENPHTGQPFQGSVQFNCRGEQRWAWVYQDEECRGNYYLDRSMEDGCESSCMFNVEDVSVYARSRFQIFGSDVDFPCPSYINYGYDLTCAENCGACGDGIVQENLGEQCDDGTVFPTVNPAEDSCVACQNSCTCQPGKPCLGFCFGPDYLTPQELGTVLEDEWLAFLDNVTRGYGVPCNAQFESGLQGGGLDTYSPCGAGNLCVPKLCCGDDTAPEASLDDVATFVMPLTYAYFTDLEIQCNRGEGGLWQNGTCCYTPTEFTRIGTDVCTFESGLFAEPQIDFVDMCTVHEFDLRLQGRANPACTAQGIFWPTGVPLLSSGVPPVPIGNSFQTRKECEDSIDDQCFGCARPGCECVPGLACVGRCIGGFFNGQNCDVNDPLHCMPGEVDFDEGPINLDNLGGICVPEVCCGDGVTTNLTTVSGFLAESCGQSCKSFGDQYAEMLENAELTHYLITDLEPVGEEFYTGLFYNESVFPYSGEDCFSEVIDLNITGKYVPVFCPSGVQQSLFVDDEWGEPCVAVWPCTECKPNNENGLSFGNRDAACTTLLDNQGLRHPACTDEFIEATFDALAVETGNLILETIDSLQDLAGFFSGIPIIEECNEGVPATGCDWNGYINRPALTADSSDNLSPQTVHAAFNNTVLATTNNTYSFFEYTLSGNQTYYLCLDVYNLTADTSDAPECCVPNCGIAIPGRPGDPDANGIVEIADLPPLPMFGFDNNRKRQVTMTPVSEIVQQNKPRGKMRVFADFEWPEHPEQLELMGVSTHKTGYDHYYNAHPYKLTAEEISMMNAARASASQSTEKQRRTILLEDKEPVFRMPKMRRQDLGAPLHMQGEGTPPKPDILTPLIIDLVDWLVGLFVSAGEEVIDEFETTFISFFTCDGIEDPFSVDAEKICILYFVRPFIPLLCDIPGNYDCHVGEGFWTTLFWLGGAALIILVFGSWIFGSLFTTLFTMFIMLFGLSIFAWVAWGYSLWCFPITPECWVEELEDTLAFINGTCIEWPEGFVTNPPDGSCLKNEEGECLVRSFLDCGEHGFLDGFDALVFLLEWQTPAAMEWFRNSFFFSLLTNFPIDLIAEYFTLTFERWDYSLEPVSSRDITCFFVVGIWFLPQVLFVLLLIGILVWPLLEIIVGALSDLWLIVTGFSLWVEAINDACTDDTNDLL